MIRSQERVFGSCTAFWVKAVRVLATLVSHCPENMELSSTHMALRILMNFKELRSAVVLCYTPGDVKAALCKLNSIKKSENANPLVCSGVKQDILYWWEWSCVFRMICGDGFRFMASEVPLPCPSAA